MPKYYCDYCDTFLTHDSPSVRKTHNGGRKHKENVRMYYQKWMEAEAQKLVDATAKAFAAGAAKPPQGMPMPPMGMPHMAGPPIMPGRGPAFPMGPMGGPPMGAPMGAPMGFRPPFPGGGPMPPFVMRGGMAGGPPRGGMVPPPPHLRR